MYLVANIYIAITMLRYCPKCFLWITLFYALQHHQQLQQQKKWSSYCNNTNLPSMELRHQIGHSTFQGFTVSQILTQVRFSDSRAHALSNSHEQKGILGLFKTSMSTI